MVIQSLRFSIFHHDGGMEIQSIIYKLYIRKTNKQSNCDEQDTFTLTLDHKCCRAKMHGGILKIDERILKMKK